MSAAATCRVTRMAVRNLKGLAALLAEVVLQISPNLVVDVCSWTLAGEVPTHQILREGSLLVLADALVCV